MRVLRAAEPWRVNPYDVVADCFEDKTIRIDKLPRRSCIKISHFAAKLGWRHVLGELHRATNVNKDQRKHHLGTAGESLEEFVTSVAKIWISAIPSLATNAHEEPADASKWCETHFASGGRAAAYEIAGRILVLDDPQQISTATTLGSLVRT
jgi:hypothetical protein